MPTLQQLQTEFLKGLTSNKLGINAQPILSNLKPNTQLTPTEQFTIYQNSMQARLQKTLQTLYPVCEKLVGNDFFLAMSNAYITHTPSTQPFLDEYGADYDTFITTFKPAQSVPYLADIATLEWSWHQLYKAPLPTPFNFTALAQAYEQNHQSLSFLLPPQSRLLTSLFPLHLIWELNQNEITEDTTLTLPDDQTSFYYLIWHDQENRRIDLLTHEEWQTLTWIQQGLTLIDLSKQNASIPTLLTTCVQKGWIANVRK